jgi:hypothetical protein
MNDKIHRSTTSWPPSAMNSSSLEIDSEENMVMPFWPVLMEYTALLNFSSRITVLKFQEFVHLHGFAWPWGT